jgi:hypothetical protein
MNEPGYNPKDMGLFFKTARQEFDEWVIRAGREAAAFENWFESQKAVTLTFTSGYKIILPSDIWIQCKGNSGCIATLNAAGAKANFEVIREPLAKVSGDMRWLDLPGIKGGGYYGININSKFFADNGRDLGIGVNEFTVMAHEMGHGIGFQKYLNQFPGSSCAQGSPCEVFSRRPSVHWENQVRALIPGIGLRSGH